MAGKMRSRRLTVGSAQSSASGEIMSHRGARAGQGRQENGVTTSLNASPHAVPAALKPTRMPNCGGADQVNAWRKRIEDRLHAIRQ